MDKHTHIFNELLFVFCMLSLQDLRKKKQELMDKEKKRQEEKVKKNLILHIPVIEILIFSYLNFVCVSMFMYKYIFFKFIFQIAAEKRHKDLIEKQKVSQLV